MADNSLPSTLGRIPAIGVHLELLKFRLDPAFGAFFEAIDNDPQVIEASETLKKSAEKTVNETAGLKDLLIDFRVARLELATGDLTGLSETLLAFKRMLPDDPETHSEETSPSSRMLENMLETNRIHRLWKEKIFPGDRRPRGGNDDFSSLGPNVGPSHFFQGPKGANPAMEALRNLSAATPANNGAILPALFSAAGGVDALGGPLGGGATAAEIFGVAVGRFDDASVVVEAAGQAFADAAQGLRQASDHLNQVLDEAFGGLERPPGGEPGSEGAGGPGFEGLGGSRELVSAAGGGFGLPSPMGGSGSALAGGVMRGLDGTGDLGTLVATFDGGAGSVDRLGETMERFREVSRGTMEEVDRVATAAFGQLEQVLVGFAETGKFEWRGLASVAVDAIGDIFAAQMKAVGAASSGGGGFGAIGDILGSVLGGLLGGAREHGGPVAPGQAFLVGEAGPELFVPPARGEIVPAHVLGGPASGAQPPINITQNFDFKGASLEAVGLLRREANRIKQEVMVEILNSAQRGGAFARMSRI